MSSSFSNFKSIIKLLKSVDLQHLKDLTEDVDISALMDQLSKMDPKQVKGLLKMMSGENKKKKLPDINADFYELSDKLSDEHRVIQLQLRSMMEEDIQEDLKKMKFLIIQELFLF